MTIPARVSLSPGTTSVLRQISARTGLSPNVIARFAMLISFEQRHIPGEDAGPPDLTINRITLFGELEPFLITAFLATHATGTLMSGKLLASHIARGAAQLQLRVSSIADLAALCIAQ